jgi:hypothetical protein
VDDIGETVAVEDGNLEKGIVRKVIEGAMMNEVLCRVRWLYW